MARSFFDRYQSGDHVRVWEEMTQLGSAVRDPQYFEDARAVARETMRRAGDNVEQMIEKLHWISPHKSSEPGSLALRMSLQQRDELIAAARDIYYVTDHYVNYPAVLVRLSPD